MYCQWPRTGYYSETHNIDILMKEVSGASLFELWFPNWVLELAVVKKAIIFSPIIGSSPNRLGWIFSMA